MQEVKQPSLFQSFIPIIILIGLLGFNVYIYSEDATYGPNQISLLLVAGIAVIIGLKNGFKFSTVFDGAIKSISSAMSAIIILLMIGALAGTWMISGVVPAMVYYGLDLLSPSIFLFAACVVSAIVSISTGSSWSTIATVGVALLGIGSAMGFSEAMIAGAVISGAYFGDKMSPLSDTTNLAPAMAGTDLITHIKYMMWTTIPSISIALILYLIIGFNSSGTINLEEANTLQTAISDNFYITPWLLLVPCAVIFLIIKKMPPIPALLIGALLGGVFAIIFQPDIIKTVADVENLDYGYEVSNNYAVQSYKAVNDALMSDVSVVTGNEKADKLLSTGGMSGMLNTIWLILCAMTFGGIMEATGMLQRLARSVVAMAKSTGALIASTTGTCVFFNITASDQYLAIVVPGRMFANTYRERGLSPENLSRTLEDSGTVTSVLVPWNTCGAAQSTVLGVATLTYLPFCFFNIISPLMTVLYGYMGWKIKKTTTDS